MSESKTKVRSSANIARHRELSVSTNWLQVPDADDSLAENSFAGFEFSRPDFVGYS